MVEPAVCYTFTEKLNANRTNRGKTENSWTNNLNVNYQYTKLTKYKESIQTQSTKLSSIVLEGSTGRRPVINSKSMTPNEKTSDLSDNFPLEAYSGAKYLHCHIEKFFY